MRRYRSKKSYCWTPDIAYLAGLIAADGCMVNNGRHINLTSKDRELIDITQKILDIDVKVPIKLSMYGGQAYHLQFSNVALYDFFITAGIMPAKSKTLSAVRVPDEYYQHFLRGYFDGDGSVHGFWDKRWKNSLMYYTEYASASPHFLPWLSSQNLRLIPGISAGRVKSTTRVKALSYAKADSQLLFIYMYPGAEPRLSRKFWRFIELFEADPYVNMEFQARVLESVDRLR